MSEYDYVVRQVKSLNDWSHDVAGTSLRGYIDTDYATLCSILGKGIPEYGDKTTQEWILEFDDNTIATIYNYKLDYTPIDRYSWHIGGKSSRVVDLVHQVLDRTIEVVDAFDYE